MTDLNSIKCLIPFISFQILPKGYCLSCCHSWTTVGHIGKINTSKSIMDVWNSEKMQYIRSAIYENRLDKVCSFKYCPIAISGSDINLDTIEIPDQNFRNIIEQIKQRKTILDTLPFEINIASSGTCNLRCIMCESNEKYIPIDHKLEGHIYNRILPEVLPNISRLVLTGNGDPIYNKQSRHFIQSIETEKYPLLKFKLITNGLMFTPKIWETIKHLNYESINISIDAATKETYEYVRKRGKWDMLTKNLELISGLRKQNRFNNFIISFVVLKSNYKEIKMFAEMGKKLGCDTVLFQRNYNLIEPSENINFTNDKKIIVEIAVLLQDTVFSEPNIDTTLIDIYRLHTFTNVSIYNRISAVLKGKIVYLPVKLIYFSLKHIPSFFDIIYVLIGQKSKLKRLGF